MFFYAVHRLLDRMSLILEQSYKDALVVSTELVKFLSINTSIEVVDNVVEQPKGFKTSIVELTKSVTSAKKDGGTISNKHDKLSNDVNGVKKRLAKVEEKNLQWKHFY